MNPRPDPDTLDGGPAGASELATAIVTASYAPDFDRCRLLCETVDRHVTGHAEHLILVEAGDMPVFRPLQSLRRRIIDERELLPSWLRSFRDPFSLFRRRVWLAPGLPPLRGWHVQQLRRIAVAAAVDAEILAFCDSDVVFVRPFDCRAFVSEGGVALFRRDGALAGRRDTEHAIWSANAGHSLGISEPLVSPHDYIATLIAWRRSAVLAMCARMEAVHGVHWTRAVAARRRFSECMLYGRFVDELMDGEGHVHSDRELCRVHWTGEALDDRGFAAFLDALEPHQVAIGMQSFIGTDIGRIRRLV
ncbi:MAG: DUF6492 family protein [Rhizobiaceae bacterium]